MKRSLGVRQSFPPPARILGLSRKPSTRFLLALLSKNFGQGRRLFAPAHTPGLARAGEKYRVFNRRPQEGESRLMLWENPSTIFKGAGIS